MTAPLKVSLADIARTISQPSHPTDVAEFNGATLKMSRLDHIGRWHSHSQQELFVCWRGEAVVRMRAAPDSEEHAYQLSAGELVVVPVGWEHQSGGDGAHVLHVELPEGSLYPDDQ